MKNQHYTNNQEIEQLIQQFLSLKKEEPVFSENYIILPGLCDVHVHFREPGFIYKETISSGSLAAAKGGYTAVCTMPNLNPVPDTLKNLSLQLNAIQRDAKIKILPYGAITKGEKGEELADMESMAKYVCAFSDDGKGVQTEEMMRLAMCKAKSLHKIIAAHCEDNRLLWGGVVHEGKYAKAHGFKGISSESEYSQIERDLRLVKETGCAYHVCHISTKESVQLIRKAKAEGLNVSCETAPHYLVLCEEDLKDDGRFKMNPPLRSQEDKEALIEGIKDGTIDMISTDHAPHSVEEKSGGLEKSLFGIVGLETAFPILYTNFVKTNVISLEKLIFLMSVSPRKRFHIETVKEDFTVFEIKNPYKIHSANFSSLGKSTPFEGEEVYAKCVLTVVGGKTIWQN